MIVGGSMQVMEPLFFYSRFLQFVARGFRNFFIASKTTSFSLSYIIGVGLLSSHTSRLSVEPRCFITYRALAGAAIMSFLEWITRAADFISFSLGLMSFIICLISWSVCNG